MDKLRKSLFLRFEERFESEDLDEHVYELKSQEASVINNSGLQEQFNYLCDSGGIDWVESLLNETK